MNAPAKFTKKLRRLLRWAWIYFLHVTGLLRWARRRIASSSSIVVLTFHRVLDEPEFSSTDSPPGMVVRRQTFHDVLCYVRSTCEVIGLHGRAPERRRSGLRPALALTFDDGWRDTAQIAYPLAKEHGLPVTVFVCPGLYERQPPFWPEQVSRTWRAARQEEGAMATLRALCEKQLPGIEWSLSGDSDRSLLRIVERLKAIPPSARDDLVHQFATLTTKTSPTMMPDKFEQLMSWEESRAIEAHSGQIGSHTHHHEILTQLSPAEAVAELADSKQAIELALGHPCTMFAYPNGSWSLQLRNLVEQQGYRFAFINSPGLWRADTHPCSIPRVNIWEGAVTGISSRFSRVAFEYTVFWRPYWLNGKNGDCRQAD